MAEYIYFSDEERTISDEEEIYKQIEELSERERKSICESCVRKGRYESVAVFFCFWCEIYVCENCLPGHKSHKGMEVWRKESEREKERETREMEEQSSSEGLENKGKGLGKKTKQMRLEAESKREEGEKSESERMEEECDRKVSLLLDDLMTEKETERVEKFENRHVSIYDRIEVTHNFDQYNRSIISGLCGLENKRLVVCGHSKSCIQIFKLGSYVLQRYIRFVGYNSKPWDVTEINLRQNSTEPNLVSGSSSDISTTNRADPDKRCLIAVTLPLKRQIMFIDLSKKHAKAQKIIETESQCYYIQFSDDKIFTICIVGPVYVYSTDGDMLNKFDTDIKISLFIPFLAVVSGRVYLTDWDNHKVQCRDVEGRLISEITIEGSRPAGISVDPDNNVYVCAVWHNKVYKLDADLTRYESVLDQTTDYLDRPYDLCYYRNMLFIVHFMTSSVRNFVPVVRLL